MNFISSSSSSSSSSSDDDKEFEQMFMRVRRWNRQIDLRRRIERTILSSLLTQITSTVERPRSPPIPQVSSSTVDRPRPPRRRYIHREREQSHNILYTQYFAENPSYSDDMFRLRFRMRRHVFLRIMEALRASDEYFHHRTDAAGRCGLTSEQKCTAAMRMLAYGNEYKSVDEHCNLAESTAKECLLHFVDGVILQFHQQYMRRPNDDDLARLLREGEERGFPGMMGSIDCLHWTWKKCPRNWRWQFQSGDKKPTLILEAVASRDLWIWHASFGVPGSYDDINVLDRSPAFTDILEGRAPAVNYMVNNHSYDMGYYLTDEMYPNRAAFIQSIDTPESAKQKLFAEKQELVRKDVELAFGVLQARFAIIRQPSLAWTRDILGKIITACIIMHNMIVEDEGATHRQYDKREFDEDWPRNQASSNSENERFTYSNERKYNLSSISSESQIEDTNIHESLKEDLIENIWEKFHEEINYN